MFFPRRPSPNTEAAIAVSPKTSSLLLLVLGPWLIADGTLNPYLPSRGIELSRAYYLAYPALPPSTLIPPPMRESFSLFRTISRLRSTTMGPGFEPRNPKLSGDATVKSPL
jgi:hypothetical protein